MAERMQAGDPREIVYSGYMETNEIQLRIDTFLREKAYDKHDMEHDEQQLPEGRQIMIRKEPYKNVTHYAKYVMKVDIKAHGLKPVSVKSAEGRKVDEGEISIVITPYLQMDWQGRWTGKPWFYALARFMDMFVSRQYTRTLKKGMREERDLLYSELKTLLGMK